MKFNPNTLKGMEKEVRRIGDWKITIHYTSVENSYMHRCHVVCRDMCQLVDIYHDSEIIGVDKQYPMDVAIKQIGLYFKNRFGLDILSMPKKGTL